MSIVKWSPFMEQFDDMEKMMKEFNGQGFSPVIDVYETDSGVVVEAPLAGVDPKDVEISISNNVLSIKGEAKKQSEIDEKNYYRKEIRSGSFFRSVNLPAQVDGDKAQAESIEGMLKITIPKTLDSKPKKIEIKTKK